MIQILNETEIAEPDVDKEVPASTPTSRESSSQTEVTLRNTQKNVIWTPSVLETVVDVEESEESDNELNDGEEGKSVTHEDKDEVVKERFTAEIGDKDDTLDHLEEQTIQREKIDMK